MLFAARQLRLPLAALAAAVVTCGLFLLMFGLVSSGEGWRGERDAPPRLYFGKVDIADAILPRSRPKPPPPPPASDPPPRPQLQQIPMAQPIRGLPRLDLPELGLPPVSGDGLWPGPFGLAGPGAEGDVVPVLVIRPVYPREAATAGIEGWVKIEFTITATGAVEDPRVVDAQPPRVFNREAVRALLRWKFKPRVVDGVAVERRAVQVIDFSLEKPER